MVRSGSVLVRTATDDDLDALVGFAELVRDTPTVRRRRGVGSRSMTERYAAVLADPARRVHVATDETGTVLGMVILALDATGELLDVLAVRASHLVVHDDYRRRGAGRALIAAAAAYAEELGCEYVTLGASPTSREANRFFARLGFAPAVMRRVATVGCLRRNLGLPEIQPERRGQAARRRAGQITGSLAAGLVRRSDRTALRGAQPSRSLRSARGEATLRSATREATLRSAHREATLRSAQ